MINIDDFEFGGIADAVDAHGFFAIAQKALTFIAEYFHCSCSVSPGEILNARDRWVSLETPLPLEIYKDKKRVLVTVAVLIQAVSCSNIAKFTPDKDTIAPLLESYPNEVLALVMGLILYDIGLKTGPANDKNSTRINFVNISQLNGQEIRRAVEIMINKGSRNHRRRFAELHRIIARFHS